MSQRNVHIGNQGNRTFSCIFPNGDHLFCKCHGIFQCLHKSSASSLDIQQDTVVSGCQLFTHNGNGDQWNTVHSRCHIPKRIQFFICRSQIAGLSDYTDSRLIYYLKKFFSCQSRPKSGNRFQFIYSSSGMSQTPTGHFCHFCTTCRYNRCNDQCSLVSDSTGRMFIHLSSFNPGKIYHIPGMSHCQCHGKCLFLCHSLKIHCHQKCRHLIIRNISRYVFFYQILNLLVV